ncbi:hypothetical protein DXG01_016459 [Tephrocybe rancida]|nr:hypothetical protein DXG01_016459 [Tephrocybe rancida]
MAAVPPGCPTVPPNIGANTGPLDPIGFKGLVRQVSGVFLVEVLITVFHTIGAYDTLGSGWGDLAVLIPISLLQWAMASFVGLQSRKLGILNVGSLTPHVIVWLGGASLCDVIITATMVTILFQTGERSAFQRTKSLTTRLIILTVNTGLSTAVWAVGDLIVFVTLQHANWHTIPFFMLSKIYSNTLMATLNSRIVIRDLASENVISSVPLWNETSVGGSGRDTTLGSFQAAQRGASAKNSAPQFHISTTQNTDYELKCVLEMLVCELVPDRPPQL